MNSSPHPYHPQPPPDTKGQPQPPIHAAPLARPSISTPPSPSGSVPVGGPIRPSPLQGDCSSEPGNPSAPASGSPTQGRMPLALLASLPSHQAAPKLQPLRSQEEESRSRDQREGLNLLSQTPEFLGTLSFPASCYQAEIKELKALATSLKEKQPSPPKNMNWREEYDPSSQAKVLIPEAQRTLVEDWARKNVWAIPVEMANSNNLPYGLAWVNLPGGAMPKRLSEWQLIDPITGRQGTLLCVTMAPFKVEPDLWASVGMGVLKKRLMFEAVKVD